MSNLLVTEIFSSIQGESLYSGLPCSFIRLAGCPLRCKWCDTSYSFKQGETLSVGQILDKIKSFNLPLVELTGGEPLAQKGAVKLLNSLIELSYKVLLETGGSESIMEVPKEVHIIMDLKCPGSGMSKKNKYSNLELLKKTDEIKFVVSSREDFDWAIRAIRRHELDKRFGLLISPAWGLVKPEVISKWIIDSGVYVRLNLQIHKYIWGPRKRAV